MDEEVALYLAAFLVAAAVEGGVRGFVEAKVRMAMEPKQEGGGPSLDQVLSAHEDRIENMEERDEEREADLSALHAEVEEMRNELAKRRAR